MPSSCQPGAYAIGCRYPWKSLNLARERGRGGEASS